MPLNRHIVWLPYKIMPHTRGLVQPVHHLVKIPAFVQLPEIRVRVAVPFCPFERQDVDVAGAHEVDAEGIDAVVLISAVSAPGPNRKDGARQRTQMPAQCITEYREVLLVVFTVRIPAEDILTSA